MARVSASLYRGCLQFLDVASNTTSSQRLRGSKSGLIWMTRVSASLYKGFLQFLGIASKTTSSQRPHGFKRDYHWTNINWTNINWTNINWTNIKVSANWCRSSLRYSGVTLLRISSLRSSFTFTRTVLDRIPRSYLPFIMVGWKIAQWSLED
jgi:hypothetical protein